ncbi:MAG: molybdopterin molybdotransferase MoeA [Flavobacteriales bacterium]|nr:molybdopterin molybdotransferase MoeA [Flavobacteriales bacterium]
MISVEEARRIVMAQAIVRESEYRSLHDAVGRVLSEDVHAPFPHPLFDMSAVDGYAVGDAHGPWKTMGRIAAGEVLDRELETGECARIFTGAQVPKEAHGVAMQEHCVAEAGLVRSVRGDVAQGANIRRAAEQCNAGGLLLPKGARLGPAGAGYLASCGVQDVAVVIEPGVSIVRTGNEFIDGEEIEPGRIFSSNEVMLLSALKQDGFATADEALVAGDAAPELRTALLKAAEEGDAVITTGGVSVGDHDLMLPVLKELGAIVHFHGVAQKPGKPMLFATLGGTPVFALPGNPRAVLVCYWEYVLPFLRAMRGEHHPGLRHDLLPLSHAVSTKGERAEFRAARISAGKATLLQDEGSHMLRTLVEADALAYLPASRSAWAEGDHVEVHYLPHR